MQLQKKIRNKGSIVRKIINMLNLIDLEKKINSELTTKIKKSERLDMEQLIY